MYTKAIVKLWRARCHEINFKKLEAKKIETDDDGRGVGGRGATIKKQPTKQTNYKTKKKNK